MIICTNKSCIWCKVDHLGDLYCTGQPIILETCDSLTDHNVVCGSYMAKSEPQKMREIHPGMNRDGLYPGQIGYKKGK